MKPLRILPEEDGKIDKELLRQVEISNIKEILSRHKEITISDIMNVKVLASGTLEFEVPKLIRDRQIICLLGYLVWFYDIKQKELK